jgi:hypothetical protein
MAKLWLAAVEELSEATQAVVMITWAAAMVALPEKMPVNFALLTLVAKLAAKEGRMVQSKTAHASWIDKRAAGPGPSLSHC